MAGTLTPRLGLYKPDPDDFATVQTDINDNYDKIDASMPPFVCTSGTRPAQPFEGQLIYETDTNRLLIRTASNKWKTVTPRDMGTAPTRTTDLNIVAWPPGAGVSLTPFECLRKSSVQADGVATLLISVTWPPVTTIGATADAFETEELVVALYRAPVGQATWANMTILAQTLIGPGGGENGVRGDQGTFTIEYKPPAGTWDYIVLAGKSQGGTNPPWKFDAATTLPFRLALSEKIGAEY